MNSNNASNDEILNDFDVNENNSSVDDFIKELELKEKDLDISSDLVIEVGESDVEHDNIHDSFVASANEINAPKHSAKVSQDLSNSSGYADLLEKFASLKKEKEEISESLKRRQRDFEAYRNRIERERQETFKNILGSLATQILPVLDNMNRALDATSNVEQGKEGKDFETFLEGIVLVNQQLNEVLMEMGVQQIPSVGEPFDPAFHEAVATEETDEYPHRTVIEELLRGYRIDDRIIRASMVKVSSSTNSQPSKAVNDLTNS